MGTDYLRTLGIALVAGREFLPSDTEGTPKVAIVNEAFLRRNKLGRDAIGKRLQRMGRSNGFDIEIVGVAANSAYDDVKQDEQAAPRADAVSAGSRSCRRDISTRAHPARNRIFWLRFRASCGTSIRPCRSANPRTMTAQVLENVAMDRFVTMMSAAFAVLATLLAALGLYGVLAYTVTQRTREFGLRMALGAEAKTVRRLVLRQVGSMTAVGAVIGVAIAAGLGRAAESLLFQMSARDPMVFAGATFVLVAVACAPGLIPAQRAARVDPMTALRYE